MRDYGKATPTWVDHEGREWIEPQIKGRLKMRIPAHKALREFVIHRDGDQCVTCGSSHHLVADHIFSRRNARKVGLVDAKWTPV